MRAIRTILFSGCLLGTAFPLAWASGSSPVFDKPLHKTRTTLPTDQDNPRSKPILSCFYYSDFMVKQVDLGEQGAEQISILAWAKDHAEPKCLRANAKNEIVIDPKVWSGYFEGVKGDFVFLRADDGYFRGMSFGVFSASDGSKIFEDAAKFDKGAIEFTALVALNDPKGGIESAIMLRYRRVYVATCSIQAKEKSCWNSIRQVTGLPETAPPDCAAAYEAEKRSFPHDAKEIDSYPSVVTYEVEVVLNRRNSVVRATSDSKGMGCYPADN
jgi:hypothetical protein